MFHESHYLFQLKTYNDSYETLVNKIHIKGLVLSFPFLSVVVIECMCFSQVFKRL